MNQGFKHVVACSSRSGNFPPVSKIFLDSSSKTSPLKVKRDLFLKKFADQFDWSGGIFTMPLKMAGIDSPSGTVWCNPMRVCSSCGSLGPRAPRDIFRKSGPIPADVLLGNPRADLNSSLQ